MAKKSPLGSGKKFGVVSSKLAKAPPFIAPKTSRGGKGRKARFTAATKQQATTKKL